jgi:hypothetical protein
MAFYRLFPIQDATLYSEYPTQNTGLDEILEASLKVSYVDAPQASRFLIQFSTDEINDVLNNRIGTSSWDSYLKCFIANVSGLNLSTTLELYPISGSWNMGTGRYLDSPIVTNGVSWLYRSYEGTNPWNTGSFATGVTASYSTGSVGGGTWYFNLSSSGYTSSISASQLFDYHSDKDLSLNVTNIITAWSQSIIPNNGFICKQQTEFIKDLDVQPEIKYFSVDTHTIYPPCLEFKWRDYNFNTGSSTLSIISSSYISVNVSENIGTFYPESVNVFRINCRPTYPPRVFQTASLYLTNYYLPTASYYAIKDLDTNEYIVDFDNQYTQLSADEQGSYFTLYMNGLQPERYYEILIKTTINGNTLVFNDNYYFKVVNA